MKIQVMNQSLVLLLVTLGAFLFSASAWGSYVKYVDADGVVHYTDDKSEAIESGYEYDEYDDNANPSPENVLLSLEDDGSLYVTNLFVSDITLKLHASDPTLVSGSVMFDTPIEIAGKTEKHYLGTLYTAEDPTGKGVEITRTFDIGSVYEGSEDIYYLLNPNELVIPFKGLFRVTQGWNGKFTHNGPKSRYAIDVSMPVGTPIVAVKAGRVLDMKMDSTRGGPSREFRPFANFIRIGHDDGTMNIYVHLSGKTERVQPGDRVAKGQVIALSGNTGYTTGPHLHFALQANTVDGIRSIKYKFKGVEPHSGSLIGN